MKSSTNIMEKQVVEAAVFTVQGNVVNEADRDEAATVDENSGGGRKKGVPGAKSDVDVVDTMAQASEADTGEQTGGGDSGAQIGDKSASGSDAGEPEGGCGDSGATEKGGDEKTAPKNKKAEKWRKIREEREQARIQRRDKAIDEFINRTRQQMRRAGKSKQEIDEKVEQLRPAILETFDSNLGGMHGKTWEDLEAGRVFHTNEKIAIKKGCLIVGVDVGKEKITARVFDEDGTELDDKKVHTFDNSQDGMYEFRTWVNCVKEVNGKDQVIVGLEPTGHYWNNAYYMLTAAGYTILIVNPNAVAKTKEVSDNTQNKDDDKDPIVIGDLIVHGHFSVPYFPADHLAALRELGRMGMDERETATQAKNQIICWMDKNFPELEKVGKNGSTQWEKLLLKNAPLPKDILKLGEEGVEKIFRDAKLRGVGMGKVSAIYAAAADTFGRTENPESARMEIRYLVEKLELAERHLQEIEAKRAEEIVKVKNATKVLAIKGIGVNMLASFLGEIGDVIRFDSPSQIIKLLGMVPVENSSGKHQSLMRISKRGRKRGRYFLIQMAKDVVLHAEEWKEVFRFYTTRENNRYSANQAYVAIAAKLVRIIFMILTTGKDYDAEILLNEFRRGRQQNAAGNSSGQAAEQNATGNPGDNAGGQATEQKKVVA